jgi:hypothetical protein
LYARDVALEGLDSTVGETKGLCLETGLIPAHSGSKRRIPAISIGAINKTASSRI